MKRYEDQRTGLLGVSGFVDHWLVDLIDVQFATRAMIRSPASLTLVSVNLQITRFLKAPFPTTLSLNDM